MEEDEIKPITSPEPSPEPEPEPSPELIPEPSPEVRKSKPRMMVLDQLTSQFSVQNRETELEAELRSAKTKLVKKDIDIQQLKEENTRLENREAREYREYTSLKREICENKTEIEVLQSEKETMEYRIIELEDDLKNNRTELSKYKFKNSELKTEKNTLIEEKDALQNKLTEKEDQIKKQKTEIFMIEQKNEFEKNDAVDMNMIQEKCEIYYNLFIRLYDKLTVTKKRLDLYQHYLKRINSGIQLSVITLSIASSFIQALDSKTYEIFFNPSDTIDTINTTELINTPTYDGDLSESTYSSTVSIVTLSISTYSALVIAAERHFGFQQRETNVEKLKESYTEPINRIKNNLEFIRPWRYKGYYLNMVTGTKKLSYKESSEEEKEKLDKLDDNIVDRKLEFDRDRKKDWISMMDKLDKEYSHIVDVKKDLDTQLDKMVSVKTLKSYQSSAPRKRRETNLENIKRMEQESNRSNFMRNIWGCNKQTINHTYDEEDANHIEDKEETSELNQIHGLSNYKVIS